MRRLVAPVTCGGTLVYVVGDCVSVVEWPSMLPGPPVNAARATRTRAGWPATVLSGVSVAGASGVDYATAGGVCSCGICACMNARASAVEITQ